MRLSELRDCDAIIRRFWSRVWIGDEDECWEWIGNVSRGYGTISLGENTPPVMRVHRFAYVLFFGALTEYAEVYHLCHTPRCVNPRHLVARVWVVLPKPDALAERN
jgi:hypothetical protein